MTLSPAHRLSHQIATTHVLDAPGQTRFIERISSMRIMLDGDDTSCCDSLDAALILLENAAVNEEDSRKILRMVSSLVALVEESVGYGDAGQVDPAQQSTREPTPAVPPRPTELRPGALQLVDGLLLGQVLIDSGWLVERELQTALNYMQTRDVRLGEALVALEYLTEEHVDSALARQAELRAALVPVADTEERAQPGVYHNRSQAEKDPRDWSENIGLRLVNEVLIGEILLARNAISREDLDRALEMQRSNGWLLGENLVHLGVLRARDVQEALRSQGHWNR